MSAFSPSFFFARFLTGRCPETGRLPIRMSQCRSSSGHKEARHVCPLQIQKPDFTLKPSGIPCQTSVTAHYAMARYNDRHRIMRHGSSYSLRRHAPYSTLPGYFQSQVAISDRFSVRNLLQHLPHSQPERRALQMYHGQPPKRQHSISVPRTRHPSMPPRRKPTAFPLKATSIYMCIASS